MMIPGSIVRQMAAIAFPAALVVCVGACTTRPSWRTPVKDVYVTPVDARTASLHAARVIDLPERPANRTMQVGVVGAIVYDAPGADARPVAVLRENTAVRVTAECHFVRIPDDAEMREYIGATGGAITPSWVKGAAGGREGWVPARCLVHPSDLAVSRAITPAPSPSGTTVQIDKLVVASATHPSNPGASRDPFGAAAAMPDLPQMGEPLETLDPQADAQARVAVAKATEPGETTKATDHAAAMFGTRGIATQADVAQTMAVAQILDYSRLRRRNLTQVEERLLGHACMARVLGGAKLLGGDDAIVHYVNWVGDRVAVHSTNPFPAIVLDFLVIQDTNANAIAVPGGPIVVTTGMIRAMRNEDELAAVLGHAIAHLEERHGLRLAKSRGLESLRDPEQLKKLIAEPAQQAAAEEFAAKAAQQMRLSPEVKAALVREMQKQQAKLLESAQSWTLDQIAQEVADTAMHGNLACESSADLRGISLAAAAGYEPTALAAVMERLHATKAGWEGAKGDMKVRASQCRQIAKDFFVSTAPPPPEVVPTTDASGAPQTNETQARWKRLQDELARLAE